MATKLPFMTFAIASRPHGRGFHSALGHAHGAALPDYRNGSGRSCTGARLGWRIRSSVFVSLMPCHSAFPSRHANQLGKDTRPCAAYIGSIRSFTSSPMNATESMSAPTIVMARTFISTHVASPAEARGRFLEYIQTLNRLHYYPLWYNAVTTNCTTNIRTQRPRNERAPWDWRILVNGKGDELLYERHLSPPEVFL